MNITAGFLLPPPDDDDWYDVYVSNSACGNGVYGYTQGEDWVGDHPGSAIVEVDS